MHLSLLALVALSAAAFGECAALATQLQGLRTHAVTVRPSQLPRSRVASMCLPADDGQAAGMRAVDDALAVPRAGRTTSALFSRAQRWATGLASGVAFFVAARPAHAARNVAPPEPRGRIEISFDAEPRELTGPEKAICVGMSGAAAGGLLYWGKKTGDEEDRDEEKRIKAETERLNKVRDEFLMDDEVVKDDDLFSSLRKRMGQEDDVPTGPEPSFDGFDDATPPPPAQPPSPQPSAPTGLAEPPSAPADPPTPQAEEDSSDGSDRDADIERLKRMFGSSE